MGEDTPEKEAEDKVVKEIIQDKQKIAGLKKDIKSATGTEASKVQQAAQDSIDKLEKQLKEKEDELESLRLPEVTESEVLTMIEIAATSEELDEIEGSMGEDIPEDVAEALEDRRQELSAGPKNLREYPELRWQKTSLKEVMKAQEECRLVGHDEKKGIALIKPKKGK